MENASETQTPDPCHASMAAIPTLSDREQELLQSARHIAETVLAPHAQDMDTGKRDPAHNLRALADAGLVGVTTPVEWGGQGASGAFLREYTEILTSTCGTTWFILTQHLGACSSLAGSSNPRLREQYLRDMASGNHYVGVGFGHLRRPDPMLRAEPIEGGWILNGVAPWVTGWPLLSGVIFGAVLPDGEKHLYGYANARESDTLHSSPPLPLCAMNASATTEVRLENYFLSEENFVRYGSREDMARGDFSGIAGAVSPPLGCARGAVALVRVVAAKRAKLTAIAHAADALDAEIINCRTEARRWADGPKDIPEYKAGALHVRAWAITLAVRAAHAAVAASGGGANALDHPAQRFFREAMFYTLTAQTADIMGATLETLTASKV